MTTATATTRLPAQRPTRPQSERDAEATRRLVAITGVPHPRLLSLLAAECGAVLYEGLPHPGVRWLPAGDPAWRAGRGGGGYWVAGSGLVPLGLCELAGLLDEGELGVPVARDPVSRSAVARWRRDLEGALPGVALAPEEWEPGDPGRLLTRDEFLGAPRGAWMRLRVGEAWVDAEVLGHLGDGGPLHVGVRRGTGVVGYTLTWADCAGLLRVPAEPAEE